MKTIDVGDRVRLHERRAWKITQAYPWLRSRTWHTVEAVIKRGRRICVVLKNRADESLGAVVWKMDVRKPRQGAERKLSESEP